ncbi:unnamed protein product, partial [Penicillium nalgiovense]
NHQTLFFRFLTQKDFTPTQTHPTFSTFSTPNLKMVRGAEYDNGVPQSDNPIENGPNKAHGVGDEPADMTHPHKVAPMPEQTSSGRNVHPGLPTAGETHPQGGTAKPVTLDEKNTAGTGK